MGGRLWVGGGVGLGVLVGVRVGTRTARALISIFRKGIKKESFKLVSVYKIEYMHSCIFLKKHVRVIVS
jgi:hypothetical protein